MAEYFRDTTGTDTLLFIDNIFRFSQAGSEVSAPWADAFGRGISTHAGHGNGRSCRSGSPRPSKGAITSVQAVYVPADDLTDPPRPRLRPARRVSVFGAFDHREGIYPAVDPLASSSRILDPQYVARPLRVARRVQTTLAAVPRVAGHHRDSRHRRIERNRQIDRASGPAAWSGFYRSRSSWPKCSPASRARSRRWPNDSQFRGNRRRQMGPPARNGLHVRRCRSSRPMSKPRKWPPRPKPGAAEFELLAPIAQCTLVVYARSDCPGRVGRLCRAAAV